MGETYLLHVGLDFTILQPFLNEGHQGPGWNFQAIHIGPRHQAFMTECEGAVCETWSGKKQTRHTLKTNQEEREWQ